MSLKPEESLQRAIVEYLALVCRGRFRYFHVPAGGHMSRTMGGIRKAMGAKAGTPDIYIVLRGGKVIELEVKTEKGRQSESQRQWQSESQRLEVPYFIVRDIDDVRAVLRQYGLE